MKLNLFSGAQSSFCPLPGVKPCNVGICFGSRHWLRRLFSSFFKIFEKNPKVPAGGAVTDFMRGI
ncbi:hypothetical protein OIK44_13195 [Janthinobacterium sp. hw3]|uniref:Uncharacterized protein n=1 Tax=Janthinobacterium fluminis TaxID=2987524 RepID=A0ABT5K2M7_9BURK|nr:hypothetical protein [Janthinobacterium fluminis]